MTDAPASPTYDRDRWFLGTHLRVVADASDTDGQLAVMEQWAPKHFSPPLHAHGREDTAVLVLEGRLTVKVGDESSQVGPGELAWLPRGIPHTFRVDSDEVRLLELVAPAGFEGFHVEVSEPADRPGLPPPTEPDTGRLVTAIGAYGGEILGPPLAPG